MHICWLITKNNPFPNKPCLRVCNISILKTLWEKEKLLGTSNLYKLYHTWNVKGFKIMTKKKPFESVKMK